MEDSKVKPILLLYYFRYIHNSIIMSNHIIGEARYMSESRHEKRLGLNNSLRYMLNQTKAQSCSQQYTKLANPSPKYQLEFTINL